MRKVHSNLQHIMQIKSNCRFTEAVYYGNPRRQYANYKHLYHMIIILCLLMRH